MSGWWVAYGGDIFFLFFTLLAYLWLSLKTGEGKIKRGGRRGEKGQMKGRDGKEGKLITELIPLWGSIVIGQGRSGKLSWVFLYVPTLPRLERGTVPYLWMLCLPLCKAERFFNKNKFNFVAALQGRWLLGKSGAAPALDLEKLYGWIPWHSFHVVERAILENPSVFEDTELVTCRILPSISRITSSRLNKHWS